MLNEKYWDVAVKGRSQVVAARDIALLGTVKVIISFLSLASLLLYLLDLLFLPPAPPPLPPPPLPPPRCRPPPPPPLLFCSLDNG